MTFSIKSISIEVFQHPTEERELIVSGISKLVPSIPEDNIFSKISVKRLEGYHKNEIIMLTFNIKEKKLLESSFSFLINIVLRNNSLLALTEKISENGDLHLRIDKQELVGHGNIILLNTSPDNNIGIYKIIAKFAYYGKKAKKKNVVKKYLSHLMINKE